MMILTVLHEGGAKKGDLILAQEKKCFHYAIAVLHLTDLVMQRQDHNMIMSPERMTQHQIDVFLLLLLLLMMMEPWLDV